MKKLLLITSLFFAIGSQAQDAPKYKYYFMMTVVHEKEKISLYLEPGTTINDLPDSLFLVKNANKTDPRYYKNYSDIFTLLSASGLEFVQMVTLPTSSLNKNPTDFALWKKRLN